MTTPTPIPRPILFRLLALAAHAAAVFAAIISVWAVTTKQPQSGEWLPHSDVGQVARWEISAEFVYALSLATYLICRGPRARGISLWSDLWFFAAALPLLLFLPWGALAVVAAGIVLARSAKRKGAASSARPRLERPRSS